MAGMKHYQAFRNIPGLESFGGFGSQVTTPSFFLSTKTASKSFDMKATDSTIPFLGSGSMSPEKALSKPADSTPPAARPGDVEVDMIESPAPGNKSLASGADIVKSSTNGDSSLPNGDGLTEKPAETDLPKELQEMMKLKNCQLCSMKMTSNLQAKMHYEGKQHKKKVRSFMINYCRDKKIPLPEEFAVDPNKGQDEAEALVNKYGFIGSKIRKKNGDLDTYCKICQVSFPSELHAQQHYQGRNHLRRIDGKPPLRTGYYNKMTGKWQRTEPTEKDLTRKRAWVFDTVPVKRPATIDLSTEEGDGAGGPSSMSQRFDPATSNNVVVIPGLGDSKKSR